MRKRVLSLLLGVCLLLPLCACGGELLSGGVKVSAAGATPEETVENFINALKKQDVETMLACCYIDEFYERLDFADYVDYLRSLAVGYSTAPTEYEYYRDLVIAERRGDFAKKIRCLTWSLLAFREEVQDYSEYADYKRLLDGVIVGPVDWVWADTFTEVIDPSLLENLEIERLDHQKLTDKQLDASERRWIDTFGVDDWSDQIVLLDIDGSLFCKGFDLVKVNDCWKIAGLNSLFLGENSSGAATPVESVSVYKEFLEDGIPGDYDF